MDILPAIIESVKSVNEMKIIMPELLSAMNETFGKYVTDPIRISRQQQNLDTVMDLARPKIGSRECSHDTSEAEARPLLEAIQDDDRKELQEIWANMLAKFATGQTNGFRRDFIETLKKMEVFDIICLNFIMENCNSSQSTQIGNIVLKINSRTSIDYDDINISIEKLISLGCLHHRDGSFAESYLQTSYGKKLYQACQPPK